jgi:hypothetical protein
VEVNISKPLETQDRFLSKSRSAAMSVAKTESPCSRPSPTQCTLLRTTSQSSTIHLPRYIYQPRNPLTACAISQNVAFWNCCKMEKYLSLYAKNIKIKLTRVAYQNSPNSYFRSFFNQTCSGLVSLFSIYYSIYF